MKKYFYIILLIILLFISFKFGRYLGNKGETEIDNIKRDTIILVDTIFIENPKEVIRWKEKEKYIYIPVQNIDTIYKNDTIYIPLQIEKVKYKDDNYEAIVSGVNPRLEEIYVYPKNVYITETKEIKKIKHWGFQITAGPGIIYNKDINYGVGIIIGVGYTF